MSRNFDKVWNDLKHFAAGLDIVVITTQEPGEAARKRREAEAATAQAYKSPCFGTSVAKYGERGRLRAMHMKALSAALKHKQPHSIITTHGERWTYNYDELGFLSVEKGSTQCQ